MSEPLPDWTNPDGTIRKLGFDTEKAKAPMSFRAEIDWVDIPDIPDSELVAFDLFENPEFPVTIKDQGRWGACTGHMLATGMERMLWQAGYGDINLSAFFPYAIACKGIDRGAVISDVIDIGANLGVCRENLVPHGTIDPRRLSKEAREDAKGWRIEIKAGKPRRWRDWISATHLRATIMHSVAVNTKFDELDADGAPDNVPGIHNHAVVSGFGLKKTRRYGWMPKCVNSWGLRWGWNGCCWLSEDTIAGDWGQSIVILSVKVKPELNPPKVAA